MPTLLTLCTKGKLDFVETTRLRDKSKSDANWTADKRTDATSLFQSLEIIEIALGSAQFAEFRLLYIEQGWARVAGIVWRARKLSVWVPRKVKLEWAISVDKQEKLSSTFSQKHGAPHNLQNFRKTSSPQTRQTYRHRVTASETLLQIWK